MDRNRSMIERYSFISLDAYELVKDEYPHAISYGNSKVIQYAVPSNHSEQLEYDEQVIINAIESGIDKEYKCNGDTARKVAAYFNPIGEF